MAVASFFGLFSILLYLGILIFGVFFIITLMKSMKQRNEYLKEIRDELRGINDSKNQNS